MFVSCDNYSAFSDQCAKAPFCTIHTKKFPLQFILNGRLRIVFHHSKSRDCTFFQTNKQKNEILQIRLFLTRIFGKINCDIGFSAWCVPIAVQWRPRRGGSSGEPSRLR